jgi:hypothetical protein
VVSSGNVCVTLRKSSKPFIGDASDHLQLATKSSMLLLYHIMLFFTTTSSFSMALHPSGRCVGAQCIASKKHGILSPGERNALRPYKSVSLSPGRMEALLRLFVAFVVFFVYTL